MNLSIRTPILSMMLAALASGFISSQNANAAGLDLFGCLHGSSACDGGLCDQGCDAATCCGDSACCDRNVGCDGMGCDGCGSLCNLSCLSGKSCMGNLIKRSDHCFDDFISPMINFVHFEDPRNLTELRPIFVNHWVPSTMGSNVPAGGTIQLIAAQFRIALTDRLSVIGVKDGYIIDNTDGALNSLLNSGWASITAGLKYNVLRDVSRGSLLSVGGTYEIPMGTPGALQRVGDGEFHVFATGGQRLWDGNAHLMSAVGWRAPVDGNLQSESFHWSSHFDVKATESLYLLTEVAWWHWVDDAEAGLPLGVAGQDLFNLPSSNVKNNNLVSQNVGAKWKPSGNTEYGLAYEFPLTGFKDVLDGRIQLEAILRY